MNLQQEQDEMRLRWSKTVTLSPTAKVQKIQYPHQKAPRQPVERKVFDILRKEGCIIVRSGWPDFAVRSVSGKVVLVEVKSGRSEVRKTQKEMHKFLERTTFKD